MSPSIIGNIPLHILHVVDEYELDKFSNGQNKDTIHVKYITMQNVVFYSVYKHVCVRKR